MFFRFWVGFLQCFANTLGFREQHGERVYLVRPLVHYRQSTWAPKEEDAAAECRQCRRLDRRNEQHRPTGQEQEVLGKRVFRGCGALRLVAAENAGIG